MKFSLGLRFSTAMSIGAMVVCSELSAQELGVVAMGKSAYYYQTSNAAPEILGYEAFAVAIPFEDDLIFGAQLEVGLDSGFLIELDFYDDEYEATAEFETLDALNEVFPDGGYRVHLDGGDGETLSVDLESKADAEGFRFPEAPRILNLEAIQGASSDQDLVIQWEPFVLEGGGSPGSDDFISFILEDCNYDEVYSTRLPFEPGGDGIVLDRSAVSIEIPSEMLSPGQEYSGYIEFIHVVDGMPFDNEELPGVLTLAGYLAETGFSFRTSGESSAPCNVNFDLYTTFPAFELSSSGDGGIGAEISYPLNPNILNIGLSLATTDPLPQSSVLFFGPPSSGLTGSFAAYRNEFDGQVYYHGRTWEAPSEYPGTGFYSVNYGDAEFELFFDRDTFNDNLGFLEPTLIVRESGDLERLDLVLRRPTGEAFGDVEFVADVGVSINGSVDGEFVNFYEDYGPPEDFLLVEFAPGEILANDVTDVSLSYRDKSGVGYYSSFILNHEIEIPSVDIRIVAFEGAQLTLEWDVVGAVNYELLTKSSLGAVEWDSADASIEFPDENTARATVEILAGGEGTGFFLVRASQ